MRLPSTSPLTTCSDDGKLYMLVNTLDQSYKNHVGFAVIRASGEAEYLPTSGHVCATVWQCILVLKGLRFYRYWGVGITGRRAAKTRALCRVSGP